MMITSCVTFVTLTRTLCLVAARNRRESGAYRRVDSIFPVALLLNEPEDAENAANRAGCRFFTDAVDFQAYVEREILVVEEPV